MKADVRRSGLSSLGHIYRLTQALGAFNTLQLLPCLLPATSFSSLPWLLIPNKHPLYPKFVSISSSGEWVRSVTPSTLSSSSPAIWDPAKQAYETQTKCNSKGESLWGSKQHSIIKALVNLRPNAHGAEFYKVMSLCAGYTNSGQNHKQKDGPETEMNGCYCCGNHFEKSFPSSSDRFAWAHYIPFFCLLPSHSFPILCFQVKIC